MLHTQAQIKRKLKFAANSDMGKEYSWCYKIDHDIYHGIFCSSDGECPSCADAAYLIQYLHTQDIEVEDPYSDEYYEREIGA